ncbi:helix-turn-helix protein [Nonomuraea fuscirosea]|uniref:Helix-turn-helix protein n=1 Tax=Nonomuraea fuscirosea TaxID=1291556 RepID=A0A2T0MP75_9ACTN|nr:helix-turn-helix protein [Nonomuraea fuscirosea]
MALVELSVVEQRYHAVIEVLSGAKVTDVAGRYGISRQSVHVWVRRYQDGGLAGLGIPCGDGLLARNRMRSPRSPTARLFHAWC